MFKIIMTLWKIVQRHTYDLLSNKYSVIIIIISFSTILVSVIQFGEVWMTWSQEKYEAVFSSFSDNIVGKSLQNKLCQNVPIDVVYTWVNGSDPLLLKQLQDYRLELQEETSRKCAHANCVPSHIVTIRHWLSDETIMNSLFLPDIRGINISLRNREKVLSNNWTFIELQSPEQAADAVKHTIHSNISLHHAHWTSDSTVPNIYEEANVILISGVPDTFLQAAGSVLHSEISRNLKEEIQNFWVYSKKRLIAVKLDSVTTVNRILQLPKNVTINGHMVTISKAYLIMELPLLGNSKDFSPSRFEDKEELRYSLRSLEKFAPWVRHVYLITNGQLPYWLDLENPRLTIVTHDMIFPNLSHLPTFSSPAIESHIHRIPGLSRKFLYLNDDVMFGREVWPDDFITNANGQKVYLSWPVPDCSDNCPWSWVADGSCDVSCNTTECSFDGGDCDLSNEDDLGLYDENRHQVNYDDDIIPYNENEHHHPRESVNDNLFHNMNFGGDIVLENVPDPDKRINSLLDILIRKNIKKDKFKENFTYFGDMDNVRYVNLKDNISLDLEFTTPFSKIYNNATTFLRESEHNFKKLSINAENTHSNQSGFSVQNKDRMYLYRMTQSQKWRNNYASVKSVSHQQHKHYNDSRFSNKVKEAFASVNNTEYTTQSFIQRFFHNLNLSDYNDGEIHELGKPRMNKIKSKDNSNLFEILRKKQLEHNSVIRKRKVTQNLDHNVETSKHLNESHKVLTKSNQTSEADKTVHKLKIVRDNAYNIKLHKLYQKLNGKSPDESEKLDGKHSKNINNHPKQQENSDYDTQVVIIHGRSEEKTSKVLNKRKQKVMRVYDAQQYNGSPPQGKKPHDTFAESLLYVNKLYNQEFGYEPRKVPAHMPHLIDIDVMEHLQIRFHEQWQLTSSHKVRNAKDMQFAFSYFYYLMSCKENISLSAIFDMFDTDHSGTWSDREIRTLLTRSFELPLSYAIVVKFENDIMNCSRDLPEELANIHLPTPPYERYQDSKLPIVSKALISNCKPVIDMLKKKFGTQKKYRYQIERDRHQDVSFKMLNSNISQLVSHLDDIRRDPKKFICLNDNLDPKREEDNAMARAILQDMYESLFPHPSSFELPPEFRNRFLHVSELQAWRANRNAIRTIVYICLALLIAFTLVNFFHMECRWLQRKFFHRTRQQNYESPPFLSRV